jgi:hypothetical protein
MATWFLAASPINRSESLNATYEGVVRFPWSLAMISTLKLARSAIGKMMKEIFMKSRTNYRKTAKKSVRNGRWEGKEE